MDHSLSADEIEELLCAYALDAIDTRVAVMGMANLAVVERRREGSNPHVGSLSG